MNKILYFILLIALSVSCKTYRPTLAYSSMDVDRSPDYSKLEDWAAHPAKEDKGDMTPDKIGIKKEMEADVFFVYPTIYYGDKGETKWNAPITDAKFNKKVDESTIQFQASAFNQAGNLYAPRYRQAHINAYWHEDKASAKKAFELAYEDVKTAFAYYLKNHNQGRPIILASHSQGTNHTEHLLKDFFDETALRSQLVAAYLVGMPIKKNAFKTIPPCMNEDELGCFVSWRTYKKGFEFDAPKEEILVTNPLSWLTNEEYISKEKNIGSILRDFNKIYPKIADAQIHGPILWATKPKFPGSIFFTRKNYHIADINFYYMNIRQNAIHRVKQYLNKR